MAGVSLLILEDEPLIMLDLEFAAEDRGCTVMTAATCAEALAQVESGTVIDVAILDVSLGDGKTCFPVARELAARGIAFLLHSGDLDRHDEKIRELDADLIAKPAAADKVIGAAIALARGSDLGEERLAAE